MGIEKVLKKSGSFGKRVLTGIALTSFLSLASCQKVNVTTPDDIVVDPAHLGMVQGRTVSAKIATSNEIVFSGYEGAEIKLRDTNFKTKSISQGLYAIDSIPAGSYNVEAWGSHAYDVEPVIVQKQQTATVADLCVAIDRADRDAIFHGILYENGVPSVGRKLELWLNDIEKRGESTTSPNGGFAFYIYRVNASHYLKTSGGKIKIGSGSDTGFINFASWDDWFDGPLLRKDATFIPN